MTKTLATLALSLVAVASFGNNVSAQISSQDLNIQGDAMGNSIRITPTATGVRITGRNGTLVNGLPSVTFVSSGPLVNVSMIMDAGNDTVHFESIGNIGDINLEGGEGNDLLSLNRANSQGNVTVKGEAGSDRAVFLNSSVLGDVNLDLGIGANSIRAENFIAGFNFTAIGGDLNDVFSFGAVTVGGSLLVSSDKGNDTITLSNAIVGVSAEFTTDEGIDRVTATGVETGLDFKLDMGAQNDTASLTLVSAFGNIGLNMGDGSDTLTTSKVSAALDAIAIGGAGTDRFVNFGFVGTIKTEVLEFEL